MNFGSVLYTAQKNDENSRQSNGWYKTGFAPPKKEQREKKLSVNVQQFLAKKEEEERQKKLEAERKKQGLLALRNQDKKSVKRVQSMMKRTKSANKSVLEDAVDHDNTAVTAAGLSQPDEDDYGYTSKTEQELYNKLIHKYNSMPSDDLFKKPRKTAKDISTTKDRVKAALQREEEEKFLPRKRKRRSKESDPNLVSEAEESGDGDSEKVDEKIDEKPKPEKFKIPKKNSLAPPPIDFQSLLKLAEKKQHEPIIIEKPVEEKPERPMTQKEKQEYLRERERKLRREMRVPFNTSNEPSAKKVKFSSAVQSKSEVKIPQNDSAEPASRSIQKSSVLREEVVSLDAKKAQLSTKPVRPEKLRIQTDKSKSSPNPASSSAESSRVLDKYDKSKSQSIGDQKKAMLMKKSREQYIAQQRKNTTSAALSAEGDVESRIKTAKKPLTLSESRDVRSIDRKAVPHSSNAKKIQSSESGREVSSRDTLRTNERTRELGSTRDTVRPSERSREFPPRDTVRPSERSREFPPRDTVRLSKQSREFPPRDTVRQFPPPDVMRKKQVPKPVRRRVIESDEDEYDSEIDDFIDDSEDTNDYSKHIKDIFGYDRSKYANVDEEDDDECMESNFYDVEREEHKSRIYGLKEDLADIRRTKLEKMLKKKRMMSRY